MGEMGVVCERSCSLIGQHVAFLVFPGMKRLSFDENLK